MTSKDKLKTQFKNVVRLSHQLLSCCFSDSAIDFRLAHFKTFPRCSPNMHYIVLLGYFFLLYLQLLDIPQERPALDMSESDAWTINDYFMAIGFDRKSALRCPDATWEVCSQIRLPTYHTYLVEPQRARLHQPHGSHQAIEEARIYSQTTSQDALGKARVDSTTTRSSLWNQHESHEPRPVLGQRQ